MKYKKWIDKNCQDLTGKTVVITGATGGIGEQAVKHFLYLNATVIMAVRNIDKANKFITTIESLNKPIVLKLDLSSNQSIDSFIEELETNNYHIDYFIHNAGIYHLKPVETSDHHEIHFQTNHLSSYLLTLKLHRLFGNSCKIVYVNSVSYYVGKIDFKDFENRNNRNKTTHYATTKLTSLCATLYLKNTEGYNIEIVHPGVSTTSMISSKNGGFGKLFDIFIVPLCKLIFMSPEKAALNLVYGCFCNTKENEIIGPRGFLSFWGYPKKHKISKKVFKYDLKLVNKMTQELI